MTQIKPKEEKTPRNKDVVLMADEFVEKDFAKEEMKNQFMNDNVGPTLRQIEAKRRVLVAQEEWKKES